MGSRLASFLAVTLAGAAALGVRAADCTSRVEIAAGQKATGDIAPGGEVDRIRVHLVGGSAFSVTAVGKDGLVPEVDLLDEAGDVVAVDPSLRKAKNTKVQIKKWPVPATAKYFVRLRGTTAGATGTYQLKTALVPPPAPPKLAAELDEGGVQAITFDAYAGSTLGVTLKAGRGVAIVPQVLEILGPGGDPLSLGAPVKVKDKSNGQSLKKVVLPEFGTYTVRVHEATGQPGAYTAKLKIAPPPKDTARPDFTGLSGGEELSGAPTVTSVSPSSVTIPASGSRDTTITVHGTGFGGCDTFSIEAHAGVALSNVSVTGSTTMTGTVTVAAGTEATALDVTVTQDEAFGGAVVTLADALTVVEGSSAPVVSQVVASTGGPFGGERVTITGEGFSDGCLVTFGTQDALRANCVDETTIVCDVPRPADPGTPGGSSVSTTTATPVDVKVTNSPYGEPEAATLAAGYSYGPHVDRFEVLESFPAQGTTGVPANLRSGVVRLGAPANRASAVAGQITGTHCFWFQSGSLRVSNQNAGFGADPRFLVYTRTGGGNLTIDGASGNPGRYILDVPTALLALSGAPLTPARLSAASNHDQWYFTIGASTDTTAPTIAGITPSNAATGVSPTTRIVVSLSEELDPLTLTTSSVTLAAGSTNVPVDLRLGDDLRSVTLTPYVELAPGTTYTVSLASSLADLCGNALAATTRTFTTSPGPDSIVPTIDAVTFDEIRADMDGSGTYVSGPDSDAGGNPLSPGSATAYDLYLPRSGWTVRVDFDDEGGAGVLASSFSAKASVASGGTAAGQELASKFDVSSTRAIWTIAPADQLAAGENVTLTFSVRDAAGNVSASRVVTVDVQDINSTASGGSGGDLDPFDTRQTWILRDDRDVYAVTITTDPVTASFMNVTTTAAVNGTADVFEALRINGMGTTSMNATAAAAINGPSTGTNAIVERLFMERLRALTRARFGIAEDGTHSGDDPNIEFLLIGEQGSLASPPVLSTASNGFSNKAFSEMDIGGDTGPNTSPTGAYGTVGTAFYDTRNLGQEANLNSAAPAGQNEGIFVVNSFKFSMNSSPTLSEWGARVLASFQAQKGGTPIGQDPNDGVVLAGAFQRSSPSNTAAQNLRYDAIMDAIEASALSVSAVTAHEIGHSSGLLPDVGPKTGMFGNAHRNNTFTEATSASPNTTHHLDLVGNDIMSPASSTDERLITGTGFQRFGPYDDGYLRHRLIHDEGK